jgi:hypothetical protein
VWLNRPPATKRATNGGIFGPHAGCSLDVIPRSTGRAFPLRGLTSVPVEERSTFQCLSRDDARTNLQPPFSRSILHGSTEANVHRCSQKEARFSRILRLSIDLPDSSSSVG